MTVLRHPQNRMPGSRGIKGGAVGTLPPSKPGKYTRRHWLTKFDFGTAQRTLWWRGMRFVVPLASSHSLKPAQRANVYEFFAESLGSFFTATDPLHRLYGGHTSTLLIL